VLLVLNTIATDGETKPVRRRTAPPHYRQNFQVTVGMVAGAGHSPMVEQPTATARTLEGLDRSSRGSAR
jgi:pimeloyl-ACP methyl ester carboxylesterase